LSKLFGRLLVSIVKFMIQLFDVCVIAYASSYFFINLTLMLVSTRKIARDLRTEQLTPALSGASDHFLPLVTLLVPAYNEEVTIVESLRSLLKLSYPAYEIVICNDGSKDRTLDVLLSGFPFVPIDLEPSVQLGSAPIRRCYELRENLPRGLKRMLLIDKDNGGKADALNACINLARGDYVTSMDADSLLIPEALLMAARTILQSPEPIAAIGGQVGLSNGSVVKDGRVIEMRLPKPYISRFQIVEYMRSFSQGRMALAQLNSLLVLSGVFALMRRDLVVAIGGFLTKHMRSRITEEYCGRGAHTVCEDMEVVVRIHRYLLDHGFPGRVKMLPFAIAWTEAPENYKDIGKQRARWYRGLLEVLVYHRAMMGRPRYREVGLFALPYQLVFEAICPLLETFGLVTLLASVIVGVFTWNGLIALLTLAIAANFCLNTLSVWLCIHNEQPAPGVSGSALFAYRSLRDTWLLVAAGFLSNLGYRQYLVVWQLRGLWDFLRGKKGWDKFARKGFALGT
jgi:cellulose synthase/poly-beta-1,6-N-acetylglucosamine synthase-like glycosyltransferase